jgi:hypothetical protein
MLKLVKLQSLVAKCCKMRKIYSPMKFAYFVLICITHGKMHHFRLKCGNKDHSILNNINFIQLFNWHDINLLFFVYRYDYVVVAEYSNSFAWERRDHARASNMFGVTTLKRVVSFKTTWRIYLILFHLVNFLPLEFVQKPRFDHTVLFALLLRSERAWSERA